MNKLTIKQAVFFNFLEKVTTEIRAKLMNAEINSAIKIKEVKLHPGYEGSETRYKKLKEYLNNHKAIKLCSGIYTLITNIMEVKAIETEQTDTTLQLSLYILTISTLTLENRIDIALATTLLKLINNNRWKLTYVLPANNLKKIDLYGLTVEAKQITGIKGWNPSIQAHAKDLYEENTNFHPQDLSLMLLSWEQTLRINQDIFASSRIIPKAISIKYKNTMH